MSDSSPGENPLLMLGENGNMALSWWENMLQDSNSECASNVKEDVRQQQKSTLHILMVGVRIWHKQYENTVQAGAGGVGNIFLACPRNRIYASM